MDRRQIIFTWPQVNGMVNSLDLPQGAVWGVPRGGAVVAGLLHALRGVEVAKTRDEADWYVDDLVDSGRTREAHSDGKPFRVLYDKQAYQFMKRESPGWIQFPWEEDGNRDAEDDVVRVIEHIGDNPLREGLLETPFRVVKSRFELFGGYAEDSESVLKWFTDDTDEMIIVRKIRYFSTCEHHMLPFWGTTDIAYIPQGAIVGLSKIPRLVNIFARRLQVQERLARQVGEALATGSNGYQPLGVAVHMIGQHFCMMARGVKQSETEMETNYLTGVFRTVASARAEFFARVK